MSDVSEQEAARIVQHMNSEHADSIQHYLEHYFHVPHRLAKQTPVITSISTAGGMTLQYGPVGNRQRKTYEFQPPLKAGEARKRLEEMHQTARNALGYSPVRINKFELDTSTTLSGLAGPILSLVLFMSADHTILKYLSLLKTPVVKMVALAGYSQPSQHSVATGLRLLAVVLFYGLHFLEVQVQLAGLLKKYNVDDPEIRRKWQIATFFIGFPAWMKLDQIGKQEERKQKTQ
ncbi:hypothetical protein OIV83_003721 [Microbotryomycetes sp. JL201]|nr:hypothetical protein OIV83_003721 [Microbotryomycetes sp. JL201]